ncbi:MAG: pirin family protein, partial [Betaproteobacteria bacterium]
ALEHKDSLGTGSVLRYGDVQRMSAGRGVSHSEFNHSPTEPVHFLQIWIVPSVQGIAPSYEEKHFDAASKTGRLRLIASPDGRDGSVLIHQDARCYAAILDGDDRVEHQVLAGRGAYVHVARGSVKVGETGLTAGDALKFGESGTITLSDARDAELLLFDLP